MRLKQSSTLAWATALAFSSSALAQEGGTPTFDVVGFAQILGPIAALIWFILFARWGGFRWFY